MTAAAGLLLIGWAPPPVAPPDETTPPSVPPPTQTAASPSPSAVPASHTQSVPAQSPSPAPTPTHTPREPRRVTINVSGDLLWHDLLWRSAELDGAAGGGGRDFYPMLASLQPLVSEADLAICHAEVPFAPAGGPFKDYPLFAAPQEVATAVAKVGWDVCTTASNHTLDQGWEGLVRTLEVHRAAGIRTAGAHATREESETPTIVSTDEDVAVCIVSQT